MVSISRLHLYDCLEDAETVAVLARLVRGFAGDLAIAKHYHLHIILDTKTYLP